MIRAAFFDLDGTLMSHATGRVPKSAVLALARLRESGVHVGLATGRALDELRQLPLDGLAFDSLLTLNGQLSLDGGGAYVGGNPLRGEALAGALALFEACEWPVLLVERDRNYLNFVDGRVRAAQAAIDTPVPGVGRHEGADVYQAIVFATREDEARVRALLPGTEVTRWHDAALDVNQPGGGKAGGLARHVAALGIGASEVVAFGDGENDVGMLRWAGTSVAMGNACDEAKGAADMVAPDIDDDGVARALGWLGLVPAWD